MTSTVSMERAGSQLKYIPLTYYNSDSEQSARELVFTLLPEWEKSPGEVEIQTFKDGITNTLLKISKKVPGWSPEQIDDASVLLRAYGSRTEILIDRDREARSHALLAEYNLAPPLLARFHNGLLYNFIPGQVCTPDDLTKDRIWRGVAGRIAEWHAKLPLVMNKEVEPLDDRSLQSTPSTMSSPTSSADSIERLPTPNMWSVMLKWVAELPSRTVEERARNSQLRSEIQRSFEELNHHNEPGGTGRPGPIQLEQGHGFELLGGRFVFAHCDLLSANIILQRKVGIAFIDYEYATPAPAAFDIANHFAEWVGYDCDYNRIPTRAVRREFLSDYVSQYQRLKYNVQPYHDPELVDRLFEEVERFRGMPGLWWGIWALIQATISQIDFNYAEYAELRLAEYWAWRAETSGSRERKGEEMPLRERRWNQLC